VKIRPLSLAALTLASLVFGACASKPSPAELHGSVEAAELGATPNVHVVDGIYVAAQPGPDDLRVARERGVRTILNLRKEEEMPYDERAAAAELGLAYVHVPWNGPDELTDAVFARGRELLNTMERPVLFHCGSANRVGAMWIPWRVLDGGISIEEARAEAQAIGLRTEAYEEKALEYVERIR
jgi:uncharacterized protein (TIGR01244 family)